MWSKLIFILSLYTVICLPVNAQEKIGNEKAKKAFTAIKKIFDTQHHTFFNTNDWDDGYLAQIRVDEENFDILYDLTPYTEQDDNIEWLYTHVIPVVLIDSIYTKNSVEDSFVVIKMKGNQDISSYQNLPTKFLAVWNDDIEIPLNAFINHPNTLTDFKAKVAEIQSLLKENVSITNPSDIVEKAVSNYIWAHKYNTEDIQKLINNSELYIPKCRLCTGAKDAFNWYVKTYNSTEVSPPLFRTGLLSNNLEEQKKALEALLNAAMNEFFEGKTPFSEEQITKMKNSIAKEREFSMKNLAGGKKCPICDGAIK